MIRGKEQHQRLARDIEEIIRNHWRRESDQGFEAEISVAQTTDAVVIQAESYNTESVIVTITHSNRRQEMRHG